MIDYEEEMISGYLNSGCNKLTVAAREHCNIPNDFHYASLLSDNLKEIKAIKNDLEDIKKWYQKSQRDYELLESELTRRTGLLSNSKVKKNKALIK